jgi:hypothetical protein
MRVTGGASEAVAAVKYGIDGARVVVVGRKLPQPVNAATTKVDIDNRNIFHPQRHRLPSCAR